MSPRDAPRWIIRSIISRRDHDFLVQRILGSDLWSSWGEKKREARRLDVCRAEPITCCSWIKYTYVADSKKPSERQQCEGKPAHALRMLTTHVYTKGRRYR